MHNVLRYGVLKLVVHTHTGKHYQILYISNHITFVVLVGNKTINCCIKTL